jgi:hypothetical protein
MTRGRSVSITTLRRRSGHLFQVVSRIAAITLVVIGIGTFAYGLTLM